MAEKRIPCSRRKLEDIAAEYGTPFYLYDESGIRRSVRALNSAFSWVPGGFMNFFAVKACPNHFIVKILESEGMGADCSSIAELELASRVGLAGNRIMFSSNSTTEESFTAALKREAMINLDDIGSIGTLLEVNRGDPPGTVCFRYNPGDAIHGTAIIGRGTEAKFGVTDESIVDAYRKMRDIAAARKKQVAYGIHIMAGSNRLDHGYFSDVAGMMFSLVARMSRELGARFSFVNLGGGIGLPYRPEEEPADLAKIAQGVRGQYKRGISSQGFGPLSIFMENGRAITGPYGFFVARVMRVEKKHRDYVRLDASEAQFPRPGIYGAYHHIIIPGKESAPHDHIYDVAGGLCENWKFAVQRQLPEVKSGDLAVMCDAGAHCFAMSFNYNGAPKAAEVLLREDGSAFLIRKRQSPHEQYRDIPLSGLSGFEV
jgi:diaminopimelate decarboxylase